MKDKEFDDLLKKAYEEKSPKFDDHINVAIVGKVSTGKSSLLNAIFGRDRSNPIAPVGAHSGVTTKVTAYRLDKHVLIMDCPGLDDVRAENSEETKNFLRSIDLGIFVVTGSVDAAQKSNFDDLRIHCKKIILVLNKIDEWDDLEDSAYENVVDQYKLTFLTTRVFGTCTKGYDPKMKKSASMDIRGVEELREEIFRFLDTEGKSILWARHLANKEIYALGIIAAAVAAVAGEAFIPGSAAYITATQAVAITSLHYLYTGEILTKASALSLLPTFAGKSIGISLFLVAKSFLPPTGAIDIVAAGIAASITSAMLGSVKWVLQNGYKLDRTDLLLNAFKIYKSNGEVFKDIRLEDFRNKDSMMRLLMRMLSAEIRTR